MINNLDYWIKNNININKIKNKNKKLKFFQQWKWYINYKEIIYQFNSKFNKYKMEIIIGVKYKWKHKWNYLKQNKLIIVIKIVNLLLLYKD